MFHYTVETADGWDGRRGASLLLAPAPEHRQAVDRIFGTWLARLTPLDFQFDGATVSGWCEGGAVFHEAPEGLWIHSSGEDGLESIEWYAQKFEKELIAAGIPEEALVWQPAPHTRPSRYKAD